MGDTVHYELESLIAAGASAPSIAVQTYWMAAHNLARNEATAAANLTLSLRQKSGVGGFPPACRPSAEALSLITVKFGDFAEASGAAEAATQYRRRIAELHRLPTLCLAKPESSPVTAVSRM